MRNLNLNIKRTRIFGEYFYTELHRNRHFLLKTNMYLLSRIIATVVDTSSKFPDLGTHVDSSIRISTSIQMHSDLSVMHRTICRRCDNNRLPARSSKHLVDRSFRRFFPTFSRLVPRPLFDINRAPTQLIPFDRPIFAWFSNFLPDFCSLEKLPGIYYFSLFEIEGSCLCQLRSNFFSLTRSLWTGNWTVP